MCRAVPRWNAVSFLTIFGPIALVGFAGTYQLRRITARIHLIERRVDDLIVEAESRKYACMIRAALRSHSTRHPDEG